MNEERVEWLVALAARLTSMSRAEIRGAMEVGCGRGRSIRHRLTRAVSVWSKTMEDKLLENEHRGESWLEANSLELMKGLHTESVELHSAIDAGKSVNDVRREAADVANYAMMVADAYEQEAIRAKSES